MTGSNEDLNRGSNNETFDYIIIGAGVIGCSTAYHLKREQPDKNILVVDKNLRAGAGNTAKSAALYRNIFSSKTSRALASSSIKYYQQLGDTIRLKNTGYLWLFSKQQWIDSQRAIQQLSPERENFDVLDREAVYDLLNINPVEKPPFKGVHAALHGHSCGALSAIALAEHYASEFEKLGGEIRFGVEVKSFKLTNEEQRYAPWLEVRVKEIIDQSGQLYRASRFIVAAGAWTHELLSPVGIFSGVLPKKRQLFGLKIKDPSQIIKGIKSPKIPAIILPTGGLYIKLPVTKGNILVVGSADNLGQPFQMIDPESDPEYFHKAIDPVLQHYFPRLVDYELKLKWAGYYAYHWPDNNPVIETVANLTWVSGTSGSGIMKADAIGRIAAASIQGKEEAVLFDGSKFRVSALSLRHREVEEEKFVI
ncbi:MAG: NAD(P)/FAD-dependent oxidoreductase [Candidatus Odinarchaeota archaeon]